MCVAHVDGALRKLDHVTDVEVSLEAKTAVITSDAPVAKEKIEKAIADAGYKVNGIE